MCPFQLIFWIEAPNINQSLTKPSEATCLETKYFLETEETIARKTNKQQQQKRTHFYPDGGSSP